MGIKTYQEKNTRPMEEELAQSDIPVKRKIQKYHISGKWRLGWFFGFFSNPTHFCFFQLHLLQGHCLPVTALALSACGLDTAIIYISWLHWFFQKAKCKIKFVFFAFSRTFLTDADADDGCLSLHCDAEQIFRGRLSIRKWLFNKSDHFLDGGEEEERCGRWSEEILRPLKPSDRALYCTQP